MPKRGRGKPVEPTPTTRTVPLASQIEFSEDMLKRLERDLKRGIFRVITPYTLAQAYNIRISAAKKILREASKRGILVLYSGGRTPIYIKPSK